MTAGTVELPAEVARTREALDALLARLDPAGTPPASGPGPDALPRRPTVVLAGAPGRGRRELAAALLGLDLPPGEARLTHDAVAVPLLAELDLVVPPRPGPATWPVAGATAVLVLVDAAAPVGADELDALARVADEVETVVLALVRIEAHRGWRTVLDADRALVADRVPRLAGARWFPVSPVLARRARERDGPVAATWRRHAGIAELQRALHLLVARRRRMLGEANALRRRVAALDAVAARSDRAAAALRDPDAGAAPTRRRDELVAARAALRHVGGEHHTRWRAALATARVAATDDLAGRLRALGVRTRDRIDGADRATLDALPARVAGDVEVLAEQVVAALGARLRALVVETLADLVPAGEPDLWIRTPPTPTPPPPRPRRTEDRLLVVVGASSGLGLTRLALLPLLAVPAASALGVALVPVSVGLGLGAAGWLARTRRLAADRAHVRGWLAEALAEVRGDLDRVLADAMIVTEREVTLALDDALARRAAELDAAVHAADRAVRADGAGRADDARAATRAADDARRGRDRAEALLARIAALRDA